MKKLAVILFFLAMPVFCAYAVQDSVSMGHARPKVGLVLSGGGAKGMAHIGVLKVLEEAGMPIDYIAGTSIGAIMGGLYAIGYTPHELDSMARSQDWLALLSDRVSRDDKMYYERESADTYIISVPLSIDSKLALPSGVVAGQNVRNLLNEMAIGYHDDDIDFDELPIPFACVAYDMVRGEEYIFRSGNLPTAIRASMSIPGAFAPVVIDSLVLVDGGIYNNFPVDVIRDMGAEIVIGVDLSNPKPDIEDVNSIMGLVDQITTIMGRDKYHENKKSLDLYMHPEVAPYTAASFSPEAIDSLLTRGERVARQQWDEIIALKESVCGDAPPEVCAFQTRILDQDSINVGSISFTGLTKNEEQLIRSGLGIRENSVITKMELNGAIEQLRGCGAFSYVTYSIDSKPPYDLQISVNEKQEAIVSLGFRFDTEEMASILLGTTLSFRGLMGPRIDAAIRLNENPYVKFDLNSSSWHLGRVGLSYMYKYNKYTFYDKGEHATRVLAHHNKVDLYFNNANPRKFSVNVGMQYEHFNYRSFLMTSGSDWNIVDPQGFVNYYATGNYENMDNYYFPMKGYAVNTAVTVHTDNVYQYDGGIPFMSVQYSFKSAHTINRRLAFIPSFYGRTLIGHNTHFAYANAIGGELEGRYVSQQMPFPGIRNVEYLDNSVMIAGLEVRMRIFARNYVSVKGAFGTYNDDFFRMFSSDIRERHIWGAAIKYSYDTAIGPISFQLDMSNRNKGVGAYLSLGKNF